MDGDGPRRAFAGGRALLVGACAAGIGLAVARAGGVAVPGWALALALLAIVVVAGVGVAFLGSGVFARPILAGRGDRPLVALTFDDGPDDGETRRVMDLLEARGHRGTFFVIGRRVVETPELVAEIARRGHGLGNHSFAHSYALTFRSPEKTAAELVAAGEAIERIAGVRTRWFRPPVGLLSPPLADGARRAGVELVGWSATARDGAAGARVEPAAARLVRGLRPGAILVLHDGADRGARRPIAAAVLGRVLDAMDARGLRSVTLDELLS